MLDWNSVQAGVDAVSDAGADVSQFAADSSSFWDTGVEYATTAFDWLDTGTEWVEDHPNSAKLLAGVVGGVGQYFNAKEQREHEEELWEREQQAQQIVPGKGGSGLGVDRNSITKGLITNGIIANRDNREVR